MNKLITHLNLDPFQIRLLRYVDSPVCPVDGEFMLRFSNDVLDVEDWTVVYVRMEEGRVVESNCLWDGCYSSSLEFLQTQKDIQRALDHDPTGQHPECYTDIVEFREYTKKEKDLLNDILAVHSPDDVLF